jgi:hypothetical protein
MAASSESKPILLSLDDELKAATDKAAVLDGRTRVHFIRIAIAEKLERMGIHVSAEHIHPPARTGKGGRPSHKSVQRKGKPDATPETSSLFAGPAKPKRKVA